MKQITNLSVNAHTHKKNIENDYNIIKTAVLMIKNEGNEVEKKVLWPINT